MIDIDTQQLQDMMNTLQQANSNITSALDTLYSVTTHDAWACVERHTINDYILENRRLIQSLQESCSNFYSVAKAVADEFVETEKGIADLFPGVDGEIAKIITIPINISGIATGGKIASTIPEIVHMTSTDTGINSILKKCQVGNLKNLFKSL